MTTILPGSVCANFGRILPGVSSSEKEKCNNCFVFWSFKNDSRNFARRRSTTTVKIYIYICEIYIYICEIFVRNEGKEELEESKKPRVLY